MSRKYLMVSFEDARTKHLADVLGNKTCKKIIDILAEKEASKTDIAKGLKIPLNTVEYNINKLVDAGLVERAKNYFWSTKGKKIAMYKVSNKSIIISPRTSGKIKSIVTVIAASGILALLVKLLVPEEQGVVYEAAKEVGRGIGENASGEIIIPQPSVVSTIISQPWLWCLAGALIIGIIIIAINWRKL